MDILRFRTLRTVVRLVRRVGEEMSFQIAFLYETLAALIASEISHARMYTLVSNEIRLRRESFVALIAWKSIFHRFGKVTTTVNVQGALLTECFAARLTNVRTLLAVNCPVRIQYFFVDEGLSAIFASVKKMKVEVLKFFFF